MLVRKETTLDVGYRAVLSCALTERSLDSLTNHIERWFEQRGFDPRKQEAQTDRLGAELRMSTASVPDRAFSARRWTLTEQWSAPKWYKNTQTPRIAITRVTVVAAESELWFWVDIEPPILEAEGPDGEMRRDLQEVFTPGVVKRVVSNLEMRDGVATPMGEFSMIITPSHLDELMRVLCDQGRFGAVYVTAAPEGEDANAWRKRVEKTVGPIHGMGIGYCLSPDLAGEFNDRVGGWVKVLPGSIRTFAPGLRVADPADAPRHKLLHPSTLRRLDPTRITRTLRAAQLERLARIPLPHTILEADRALNRAAEPTMRAEFDRRRSEKHTDSTTSAGDLAAQQEQRELMELAILAADEEKARADYIQQMLDKSAEELKDAHNEATVALDIAATVEVEKTNLASKLDAARNRVFALETLIGKYGEEAQSKAQSSEVLFEARETPTTWSELLDRFNEFRWTKFYGPEGPLLELEEKSDLRADVVAKAWSCLLTFEAYIEARRQGSFEQSLLTYIQRPEHGLPMHISCKVVPTEGETVLSNARMVEQRTVRGLPPSISPDGSLIVKPHVRLADRRGSYPRLYFHDAYSSGGIVVVGYIGPHPENASTN